MYYVALNVTVGFISSIYPDKTNVVFQIRRIVVRVGYRVTGAQSHSIVVIIYKWIWSQMESKYFSTENTWIIFAQSVFLVFRTGRHNGQQSGPSSLQPEHPHRNMYRRWYQSRLLLAKEIDYLQLHLHRQYVH
jgi:hypothetical protein